MKLHELQEKRSAAVTAMRALADKCDQEGRDYNADEEKRHSDLKSEIITLDSKIQRAKDVAELERSAPAIVSGNGKDGDYSQRARQFSLVKAINAAMGEGVDAGFEREISQEVSRRSGRKFQGIAVPDEYFTTEKRTLLTSGDAASLYPTQHRADLYIDLLRSQLVTGRLGATILDGLVGDQDIPKQIGSTVAQWVAEDAALTESDPDFDDVKMTPKTVGAMTSYSRRTLINAVPSIEAIVRRDLAATIANAIDLQAIIGDGTGNKPTGVIHADGVHNLTLAGPTWAQVLEFIASIQTNDADLGTLGWALTPRAVAKLRGTNKVTAEAEHGFLMTEPGTLAGYPAAVTTALPTAVDEGVSTSLTVFGAWNQLLIGYWSATDILVNPYADSAYARGRVLIRAMRDVDVAVRHGESFAYADDLTVSA